MVELSADDLKEIERTRPLNVQAILAGAGITAPASGPMSGPGIATPFMPSPTPPPVAYAAPATPPNETMRSPSSPPPYGTLQSPAFAAPMQPQMTQQPVQPQVHQSAYPSVAPVAMSVSTAPPAPKKKSNVGVILAVLGVLGVVGALGVGGAGFAYWKWQQAKEDAAQQETESRQKLAQLLAPSDTSGAVDPLVAKDEGTKNAPAAGIAGGELDDDTTTAKAAPTHVAPVYTAPKVTASPKSGTSASTSASTGASAAPSAGAGAKPAASTASSGAATGGKGIVRTWSAAAGKPIVIDGVIAATAPSPVTVTCGEHQIQVGDGRTKKVNVPCNGAITVGSPDGT